MTVFDEILGEGSARAGSAGELCLKVCTLDRNSICCSVNFAMTIA